MHLISTGTAPTGPFAFIVPSSVALIFLFIVMYFTVREARSAFKDKDVIDGILWTVASVIVFGLNVMLAMIDIGGLVGLAPDGTPEALLKVFDYASLAALTIILVAIMFRALHILEVNDGPVRYHKLRSISWFGFALISLAVLLWDGVFRAGLLSGVPNLDYRLIFGITLGVGVGLVVIGWVVFGIAKARRRVNQERAIHAR